MFQFYYNQIFIALTCSKSQCYLTEQKSLHFSSKLSPLVHFLLTLFSFVKSAMCLQEVILTKVTHSLVILRETPTKFIGK